METRNPTGQTDNPKDFQPDPPNFTSPPVTIEHSFSELGDMFCDFEFNSLSVQGNVAFDEKETAKLIAAFRAQRAEECGDSYSLSLKGIAEIRKFRDKLLYMNLRLK
jgi:hypothetical protein